MTVEFRNTPSSTQPVSSLPGDLDTQCFWKITLHSAK